MFDILMFLFESYFHAGRYPNSDKLSRKLSAAGFEDEDIHLALTWLSGLEQLNKANYPSIINDSSGRFYADLEIKRMSFEVRCFLTFWEQNKIITPVEREMILDRAVALNRENLPLDKVKLITLMVLWNQRQDLDPLIVEDLLTPADSSSLH
ncbi:MAG: Smg protein [Candidatus Nitrotoga sp. SPKER]|nr:MAG: Smg protein [Candidatus Nitrotoga sp. SPKER]